MTDILPLELDDLIHIMPIEQACHTHPCSEKVMGGSFSRRYHNFKLVQNGQIIGFYIADLVVDELTLQNICIAPNWQGKGLGKQLFKHFLDTAKRLGAMQLWLEVRESNTAAIALYESHDFIETGKRPNYYPTATGREDALLMGCTLLF